MTSTGFFVSRRWKNGTTRKIRIELTHNNEIILGRHRASPSIEHHITSHRAARYCTLDATTKAVQKNAFSLLLLYNCAEWALFSILLNTTTASATTDRTTIKKQICHIVFPANANYWNWAEPKKDHIGNSNVNGILFGARRLFIFFLDFFTWLYFAIELIAFCSSHRIASLRIVHT